MVGSPWACSGDAEGVWGGGGLEGASAYHPIRTAVNHDAAAAADEVAHAGSTPPALDAHGLPGPTPLLLKADLA